MAGDQDQEQMNLAALTPQQMADVLSKAGGRAVSAATIEQDISDGAPVDERGMLNILTYAAWLAKAAQAAGH